MDAPFEVDVHNWSALKGVEKVRPCLKTSQMKFVNMIIFQGK
jgi:hypothetical protein